MNRYIIIFFIMFNCFGQETDKSINLYKGIEGRWSVEKAEVYIDSKSKKINKTLNSLIFEKLSEQMSSDIFVFNNYKGRKGEIIKVNQDKGEPFQYFIDKNILEIKYAEEEKIKFTIVSRTDEKIKLKSTEGFNFPIEQTITQLLSQKEITEKDVKRFKSGDNKQIIILHLKNIHK